MYRSLRDDFLVGGQRWKERIGEIVHPVPSGNLILHREPQVHIYQLAEGLDLPGGAHVVGVANSVTAGICSGTASGPAVSAGHPFDEREVPFDLGTDAIDFVELVLALVVPLDEMLAGLVIGLLVAATPPLLDRDDGLHAHLPERVDDVV